MSFKYVDTHLLIEVINSVVGLKYEKSQRNYYRQLKDKIQDSSYVPEDLKSLDFSRVVRNMRSASEQLKSETTISSNFLRALYAIYLEEETHAEDTDEELWSRIIETHRSRKTLLDPLSNTSWYMYFLDNDEGNNDFHLIQGLLSFGETQIVNLQYQRNKEMPIQHLVGRRFYLTDNNNILKLKFWTDEKHVSSKEPYTVVECVVHSSKKQKLIEGAFLFYEGNNTIYSGMSLITPVPEDEKPMIFHIDLYDRIGISKLNAQSRLIARYFMGRYKNLLETNSRLMHSLEDLGDWIEQREKKVYRKDVDLFISTPISVLDENPEKKITVALISFFLKRILQDLYGFKHIFCSIIDGLVMEDRHRYRKLSTIKAAKDKFTRSKRYLFLSPVKYDNTKASSSLLELGWALLDSNMMSSYILTCHPENLPKYIEGMADVRDNFGLAPELECAPDNITSAQLCDYFDQSSMVSVLYEMSQCYGKSRVNESDIQERINSLTRNQDFMSELDKERDKLLSIFL